MSFPEFDRHNVKFYPLRERENRVFIERDGRRLMVRPEQAKPKAKPSEVKSDG